MKERARELDAMMSKDTVDGLLSSFEHVQGTCKPVQMSEGEGADANSSQVRFLGLAAYHTQVVLPSMLHAADLWPSRTVLSQRAATATANGQGFTAAPSQGHLINGTGQRQG